MATTANHPITIGGHKADIEYQESGQNTLITLRPNGEFPGWNSQNISNYLNEWCQTDHVQNTNFAYNGPLVTGTFTGIPISKAQGFESKIQEYLDTHLKKPMNKAMGLGGANSS